MTSPLFVGIDASTSACKAIVFDESGCAMSEGRASIGLHNPSAGAWEQDAMGLIQALERSLYGAMSGLDPAQRVRVRSISIACQRETFVVTNPKGAPLCPAIVWMDGRAAQEVREVCRELPSSTIHALSGKMPCTTPSLYKLRFLFRRHRKDLATEAKWIFDVHGFLVFHLTGVRVTSLGAADPMGIVDMRNKTYAPELLELAGVTRNELSELVESATVVGSVRSELRSQLLLPDDVVVVAGTGDGQAAALGAGIVDEHKAYLNIGTAVVMGRLTPCYRTASTFRTLFGPQSGSYFAESDLKGGTFTLDWLSDRLLAGRAELSGGSARQARLAELEREAEQLPIGSHGLMCLPYFQGVMNPYWDDSARGAFLGLTGDHGAGHLYRAIVEGLAFEQRLALDGMETELGPTRELVAMGGGADRPFVAQVFADVLGRPIAIAKNPDATALGAAVLAAVGTAPGGRSEIVATMTAGESCRIGPREADAYRPLYERYRAIYPALARISAS